MNSNPIWNHIHIKANKISQHKLKIYGIITVLDDCWVKVVHTMYELVIRFQQLVKKKSDKNMRSRLLKKMSMMKDSFEMR